MVGGITHIGNLETGGSTLENGASSIVRRIMILALGGAVCVIGTGYGVGSVLH